MDCGLMALENRNKPIISQTLKLTMRRYLQHGGNGSDNKIDQHE